MGDVNSESSIYDDHNVLDWLHWICFHKTSSVIVSLLVSWLLWSLAKYLWHLYFIFSLLVSWLLWSLAKYLWHLYFLQMRDIHSKRPLPPGQMGYPIIGETLQFFFKGADFYNERISKYGRIFKTHLLGSPTVRVIGAENVRKILLGEHIIVDMKLPQSGRILFGSGAIVNSFGHGHRMKKKNLLKAFNYDFLSGSVQKIHQIIKKWGDNLCDQGEVLGFERCKILMNTLSAEVLLGFNLEDDKIASWLMTHVQNILNAFLTFPWKIPGTSFAKGMKSKDILLKEIKHRLQKEETSQSGHVCMTDMLRSLEAEDDSSKPDDIADALLEMWFAGSATQSSAACSLLLCVGRDDHIRKNIQMELEKHHLVEGNEVDITYDVINQLTYTSNVVKEVLRLLPPVGGGFRQTKTTIELGGYQIPKGWTVIYSIRDTHHTTDLFPDPHEFRPERWETVNIDHSLSKRFNYIPFSAGARRCLGENFANLVLKLFLIEVVGSYNWTLRNKNPNIKYFPITHPADKLPVSFSKKRFDSLKPEWKNGNN